MKYMYSTLIFKDCKINKLLSQRCVSLFYNFDYANIEIILAIPNKLG